MHEPTISTIRINGGRLSLDFVNTATWTAGRLDTDFLLRFADLVAWGERESLIDRAEASELLLRAGQGRTDGIATVVEARELRGALRALLEPGTPQPCVRDALDLLNGVVRRTFPMLWVETGGSAIRYAPAAALGAWLLGPVAVSALELATSPARSMVRVCPGDGCRWLFLDHSRNATRRWCSMQSCGNKAKARAHYDTHRRKTVKRASDITP